VADDRGLVSGALPPDWSDDPPDPPAEPSRWVDTGMPGGARVDPSEYDAVPGRYDTAPVPAGADAREALAYQRAAYASGSPHVLRMTACTGCRASISFYGRAERLPAEPRCPRCADDEPPPRRQTHPPSH